MAVKSANGLCVGEVFYYDSLDQFSVQASWVLLYGGFIGIYFAAYAVSRNLLTLTFDNKSVSPSEIFKEAILENLFRTFGRVIYFILLCVVLNFLFLHDMELV